MIKKLLLFLVLMPYLQNTFSQGAEIKGNCIYLSASQRIVIRLALTNPTGSSQGQMQLVGIRFGVQYNAAAVTYDGFRSYMNSPSPGLDDASYLSFIGKDTNTDKDSIGVESTPSRSATVLSPSGNKTLLCRYINRSSTVCDNAQPINPGESKVLIDIYFKLVNNNPDYYHLNESGTYGWNQPEFIAQFFTKDNGGLNGILDNDHKEIAIVIIRQGSTGNPYQPFDLNSCDQQNVNPIVVTGDNVNFISPANGVLAGKVEKLNVAERNDHVAIDWNVENNELVDHYEIERKEENGSFRTIGMIMSDNKNSTTQYQFNDKITARDLKLYYRVKTVGEDQVITYSDIKMVRPGSVQQNVVKVFPNPTSDLIRFNAPLLNGYYVCRIYSNEGRMVLTANVSSANQSINIKNLKAGSYFIEIYHPQSDKRFYSQFSKF